MWYLDRVLMGPPNFFETPFKTRKRRRPITNKAKSELIYLRVLRHDIGTAGAGARTVHIYNKQQTMLWLDYCDALNAKWLYSAG